MRITFRDQPTLTRPSELYSFLQASPLDPQGWSQSAELVKKKSFPRKELADVLFRYNKSIGADTACFDTIKRFKDEQTLCVFTGQQLGLMGGPAYTILKAVSCLALAKEKNAVPVFWLATEDHDVDEIDHTYLIEATGNLRKFHLSLPKDGRSVEDLPMSRESWEVVKSFLTAVDCWELFDFLEEGISYPMVMARVLAYLFRGTGLVFLEPRLLRPFAQPFFEKEIRESGQINAILRETTSRLEREGGAAQLDFSQSTNLFLKEKGVVRTKIEKSEEGFLVGKRQYTEEQLLSLLSKSPELFSTNAAARPVLQSWLFPVAAYIAGPGEIAYFHQLKEYFSFHGAVMPWVTPRVSATFITPEAAVMLEKCRLQPWDEIPQHWPEVFSGLDEGVDEIGEEWLKAAQVRLSGDISGQALSRFVQNSIRQLKRKISLLRLKKRGIPPYSLHYLRNLIHPQEKLQERVVNWWEFQSRSKENLVDKLLECETIHTPGHHYCYL